MPDIEFSSGPISPDRGRQRLRILRALVLIATCGALLLGVGAALRFAFEWQLPVILHAAITFTTLGLLMLIWRRIHRPRGFWTTDPFTSVGRIRMTGFIGGMAIVGVVFGVASVVGIRSDAVRQLLVIPYVVGTLAASLAFVGPIRMTRIGTHRFAAPTGHEDQATLAPKPQAERVPRWLTRAHAALVVLLVANHLLFPFWSAS